MLIHEHPECTFVICYKGTVQGTGHKMPMEVFLMLVVRLAKRCVCVGVFGCMREHVHSVKNNSV